MFKKRTHGFQDARYSNPLAEELLCLSEQVITRPETSYKYDMLCFLVSAINVGLLSVFIYLRK